MSLTYTTGSPANLTAGVTANMTDISGPFADIKTFLTDGSGAVGDTILASPSNPVWRTVITTDGIIASLTTTAVMFAGNNLIASGAGTSFSFKGLWVPQSTDLAVTGKTTRLRLRVAWSTNTVAPAITLTWGLYPISAVGGAAGSLSYTLGTVVAGSTVAVATPIASTANVGTSAGFDVSAVTSGNPYIIGVVGSGSQAANSQVGCQPILEMRHT